MITKNKMNLILRRDGYGNIYRLVCSTFLPRTVLKRFTSDTMRAVCIDEFGSPDVLKIKEVPRPTPGKSEVLVKVYSAGVNPVDTYIREGVYANIPQLPLILGKEAAGVVEELGEDVTQLKVGDRVTCCLPLNGGYAEYVKCDENRIIKLSDKMSFSQGAALYVAYFSAIRALITKCKLKKGENLLVHGASGAVGIAAVQIGKYLGANIVGTAGTEPGLNLVKSNGADHALNHRKKGYALEAFAASKASGFDAIIENCAHLNLGTDLTLLRNDGRIAVVGSRGSVEVAPRYIINTEAQIHGIKLFAVTETEFKEYSDFIINGVEEGFIHPHIGQEYSMVQVASAHKRLISNVGAKGKLVLKII